MHCISFCIKLDTMVILFSIFIATTCTGTSTSIIAVVCSYVCLCLVKFLVSDKFLFLRLISSWIIVFFFLTILQSYLPLGMNPCLLCLMVLSQYLSFCGLELLKTGSIAVQCSVLWLS